jgi:hypothetical protein
MNAAHFQTLLNLNSNVSVAETKAEWAKEKYASGAPPAAEPNLSYRRWKMREAIAQSIAIEKFTRSPLMEM